MLKKILYNKYEILDIPKNLPLSSEEFFKVLFDLKNVVMFRYGEELRLLRYSGFHLDWLGRATKWQPIPMASGETYDIQDKNTAVLYQENVLCNDVGFNAGSYIIDDIDRYVQILNCLDECVVVNTRQVYLPFIAKVAGSSHAEVMKKFFEKILGKDFRNLIVEEKMADAGSGTIIEPTNMQLFIQQIQDTKKKILDEAFFYLGVSSPQGKLAHQSEIEIESASAVVDLLDEIMSQKIVKFLNNCNKMFGCKMKLVKRIGA